jgi:predicted subunit of tRNA(5-methylaminomethyl-2-thiouridylate) methyltransferase
VDRPAGSEAVVLFSGGSDSALTAIRVGARFDRVHLVTFQRRGVYGRDEAAAQATRLARFFGDPGRFTHDFIPTDRLCRRVMYENYLVDVARHGMLVLSQCGLCKVSFHWRALVYCLEHGIRTLADGAVRVASIYPEQNEVIMLNRLRELYGRFGIAYENPIYEEGDRTEQTLYELRFNRTPKVKGTKGDRQMVCEQQILYAMFLRHYLPRVSHDEFERRMAEFYRGKFDLVEEWTREWVEKGPASRLAPLIEL